MERDSRDTYLYEQLGELKGKISGIDAKVSDIGTTTNRRLNEVAKGLFEVRDQLRGVEVQDATKEGRFAGAGMVVIFLCTGLPGLISCLILIYRLIRGH